jgi:hypothetical protein
MLLLLELFSFDGVLEEFFSFSFLFAMAAYAVRSHVIWDFFGNVM